MVLVPARKPQGQSEGEGSDYCHPIITCCLSAGPPHCRTLCFRQSVILSVSKREKGIFFLPWDCSFQGGKRIAAKLADEASRSSFLPIPCFSTGWLGNHCFLCTHTFLEDSQAGQAPWQGGVGGLGGKCRHPPPW